MNTQLITIIISLISVIVVTGGFIWKVSKDGENKRKGIFRRIDEVKEANKKEFVLDKVCTERHKRTDETMERIETNQAEMKNDIKTLLSRAV